MFHHLRSAFCLLPLIIAGCGTSTTYWVEQAQSSNPSDRQHAVQALRERVDEEETVVPVLTKALDDENKYVRRDAAKGLGRLGAAAKPAVPALEARLLDGESSVRKAAARALAEIRPSDSL